MAGKDDSESGTRYSWNVEDRGFDISQRPHEWFGEFEIGATGVEIPIEPSA